MSHHEGSYESCGKQLCETVVTAVHRELKLFVFEIYGRKNESFARAGLGCGRWFPSALDPTPLALLQDISREWEGWCTLRAGASSA